MSERAKISAKAPETKRENFVSRTRKSEFAQSIVSPYNHVLFLHRTIGNQAVQRLFKLHILTLFLVLLYIYQQLNDGVDSLIQLINACP